MQEAGPEPTLNTLTPPISLPLPPLSLPSLGTDYKQYIDEAASDQTLVPDQILNCWGRRGPASETTYKHLEC